MSAGPGGDAVRGAAPAARPPGVPAPWGRPDDPVPPGEYEHAKGGRYEVLGLALLADGPGEGGLAVVYRPLYPVAGPPLAVRSLVGWREPRDGRERFRRVAGGPAPGGDPGVAPS